MTLKRSWLRRLAILAVVAAGSVTAAAPTLAQPSSAFGFQFNFGGDAHSRRFQAPSLGLCLTDRQIKRSVAEQGYDHVMLGASNGKRVQVRANRDGFTYLLRFNFCTDEIEASQRLRAAN